MRMSKLFSQTLREIPSEAEAASHQWMLRGGFIRQTATGIFSYLPLGLRVIDKISAILRQEMNAIGGQEILMPIVNPAALWKESGRWDAIDAELGRFVDRANRDMVLAMTHEEVISDLVRKEIKSYRQLPQLVYHIQTKWRDDPRPRAGLIRVREFIMKDSYTLDADWDGLDRQYKAHYQAYFNIFRLAGLDVIAVSGDVGMMGGKLAHEFMVLTPVGEDTLLLCSSCDYAANRQVATFRKPRAALENQRPIEKVATPECKTIDELTAFLGIQAAKTAKAVFMIAERQNLQDETEEVFVFAMVRGDMDVNETKLQNALKARSLRPATDDEIHSVGAEPGYASPVDLNRASSSLPVICVVDEMIAESPNLVSGANEYGTHLMNVNYGRDFQADVVQDITAARDGDLCPSCGAAMRAVRGVEVGNIFQLGTRYSDAFGCTYQDRQGVDQAVIMGSYGIGVGRLMGCVAETSHDGHGLIWPITIAPFQVHLVWLGGKGSKDLNNLEEYPLFQDALDLYHALQHAGVEVLFDDRVESPGVKFNDADLIGVPIRLTISSRSIDRGGLELKRRDRDERSIIKTEDVIERVKQEIDALESEIKTRLRPEAYKLSASV